MNLLTEATNRHIRTAQKTRIIFVSDHIWVQNPERASTRWRNLVWTIGYRCSLYKFQEKLRAYKSVERFEPSDKSLQRNLTEWGVTFSGGYRTFTESMWSNVFSVTFNLFYVFNASRITVWFSMYNALINSDKDDSILHLIDSARRLPVYVHLLKYFNVQIEILCHRFIKQKLYPIKMHFIFFKSM